MAIAVISMEDNASLWETGRDLGVQKFRYLTHPELVQRVCLQCLFYHNTVWDLDDPNAPEPPLHPLCACTREPEFDAGTLLGQDPDGNPIIADPEPAMEPGQFLRQALGKLSAEELTKAVGPTKARLLKAKLIEPESLVSRTAGIRPVDSLLKSAGVTKEELKEKSLRELRGEPPRPKPKPKPKPAEPPAPKKPEPKRGLLVDVDLKSPPDDIGPNVYGDARDAVHLKWAKALKGEKKNAVQDWLEGGQGRIQAGETGVYRNSGNPAGPDAVAHAKAFNEALDELPAFQGVVYRGAYNISDDQLAELSSVGKTIRFDSSGSASTDPRVATHFAAMSPDQNAVLFEIESRTARDISRAAERLVGDYAWQKEVVVRSNTRYEVVSVEPLETPVGWWYENGEWVETRRRKRVIGKGWVDLPITKVRLREIE